MRNRFAGRQRGFLRAWLSAHLVVVGATLILSSCTSAQDRLDPIAVDHAREAVTELLTRAAIPAACSLADTAPRVDGDRLHFRVSGESRDGLCPVTLEGHVTVRASDSAVMGFTIRVNRAWFPQEVLPEPTAYKLAEQFLQEQFPAMGDGDGFEGRLLGPVASDSGVYRFYFVKREGGFLTPWTADVHVTAYSGEVVFYSRRDPEYSIPDRIISEQEAIASGRAALTRSRYAGAGGWRLTDTDLVIYRQRSADELSPAWALRFVEDDRATGAQDDGRLKALIDVHAITGKVIELMVYPVKPEPGTIVPVNDHWPAWIDTEMLAFVSARPRYGHPVWRPKSPALFITDLPTGVTSSLLQPFAASCQYPCVDRSSGFIVCEMAGILGLCLSTGEVSELASEARRGSTPCVSGGMVTFSATRRHGDEDIFAFDFSTAPLHVSAQRRLARLDGIEILPVFQPGASMVFFAHTEGIRLDDVEENWAVCSVSAAHDAPVSQTPRRVADGFGRIHRLSFFPDGSRLLVAHARGLDVVDVETGTREPLGLPELHDPDLPQGPPLRVREPAVSPDGGRLAFSGYRDAGERAAGSGWYIYVCNLDGSDLRRVTPLGDDPVEPYVFPETGKTAFDVAREILEAHDIAGD